MTIPPLARFRLRTLGAGRLFAAAQIVFTFVLLSLSTAAQEWRYYGGDAGGTRFSPLEQISRENVNRLKRAWIYHTGEVERAGNATDRHHVAPFESTPLVIDGTLYFSTPSNRVIALDAETGAEIWKFDPQEGSAKLDNTFNIGSCLLAERNWKRPKSPIWNV